MKTGNVDYSKNIWKEKMHGLSFIYLLVGYQWKNFIENCNAVVAGAQNIEHVVSFWPDFDQNFTDICGGKLYVR